MFNKSLHKIDRYLNKLDHILPVLVLAFMLVLQPVIHSVDTGVIPTPDGYNKFLWRSALCSPTADLDSEGNQGECSLCALDIISAKNLYDETRLAATFVSWSQTYQDIHVSRVFNYSTAARAPPYS